MMGLIQLHKPKCEPVTLELTKNYLRIDHHEEDVLIAQLIRTARQSVESYTARSFIRQAWRFTVNAGYGHAQCENTFLTGYDSTIKRGIELPRSPFIEIIDKPQFIDNYGARGMEGYRLDMMSRVCYLHFTNTAINAFNAHGQLQIDFWAGYGDSTDDIPDPLRHAILMTIAQLYSQQSSANDNGIVFLPLDESVLQMIKPYRLLRLQ